MLCTCSAQPDGMGYMDQHCCLGLKHPGEHGQSPTIFSKHTGWQDNTNVDRRGAGPSNVYGLLTSTKLFDCLAYQMDSYDHSWYSLHWSVDNSVLIRFHSECGSLLVSFLFPWFISSVMERVLRFSFAFKGFIIRSIQGRKLGFGGIDFRKWQKHHTNVVGLDGFEGY